jgi:hypothetical protein
MICPGSWSVLAVLLGCLPLAVHADIYDVQAARARAATGNQLIKCSPDGGSDTISVAEAVRLLKPGDTLQLHPGRYESPLIISHDKVIIEGGTRGYCEVKIELSGKNCVIRNLWANHLELVRSAIIVDSIFNFIRTSYDRAKIECVLYNSCCRAIYVCDARNTIVLVGCTVLQSANRCFALGSYEFGEYKIRDSIVYAKYMAIRLRGNPKLEIERSLFFGDEGVAKEENIRSKHRGAVARDLASLKKLAKCRIKGECLVEKPAFRRPSTIAADRKIGCLDEDRDGNGWFWTSHSKEAPDFYLLAENSPLLNKSLGANLDEHGFPVPRTTAGDKPDSPPATTVE